MKTKLFTLLLFSLLLSSCGASKKQLEAQNLEIQQQLFDLEQKQKARPKKVARQLDPCEELALEESQYFRAAANATASDENKAKQAAMIDARNQLAQMIRVVVNGQAQDQSRNENRDNEIRTQAIGEEMMNQYVYQSVEYTKPILWSIYDLSDGTVQVYVCMEMTKDPEEFTLELQSRLNQNNMGATPPFSPLSKVNPEAEELYNLGRENCIKNNYDIGIPQLMQALEMGSFNAQYYVGLLYLYGDHVEQDSKIAFQYILSAANGGSKDAIFQTAEMYNSGTGVTKDKEQARFWYRRSKEAGDTRAESRLRRL